MIIILFQDKGPKFYCMMLKEQCHEIFCYRFFARIIFPQAPENNTRVIFKFKIFKIRSSKSMCTTRINDIGGKQWTISDG